MRIKKREYAYVVHEGIAAAVIPAMDLMTHNHYSETCKCNPDVEHLANGGVVYIHKMLLEGHFFPILDYNDRTNWRKGF